MARSLGAILALLAWLGPGGAAAVGAEANPRFDERATAAAPEPIVLLPLREGGALKNREISIPSNLRLEPERRLTVGYTASNSYLNPGFLICRGGGRCRLDYETDHTGNLPFLEFSQPILERWELGLATGSFEMGDVAAFSPIHQLVSDHSLRYFHEHILGDDSLPALSNASDGREVFYLTDFDGRGLRLKPNRFYTLPLRVDLTRYFDIRQSARSRMSLNAGLHLSYPLEGGPGGGPDATAFARGIGFGISVNFVRTLRITPNLSSTFHVQLARFRPDVHAVYPSSPLSGNHSLRSAYTFTYGLRFGNTFKGHAPCSFAMSEITTSARYGRKLVWAVDTVIFAGGKNLRASLTTANDFGVLSFACTRRARQYQVALIEDIGGFSQLTSDDGSAATYDPDFTVTVGVSFALGAKRRASGRVSE